MAANIDQKIAVLDIDANVKETIEAKLLLGFVVQSMVVWQNKLLVIYATPVEDVE